MLATSRGARAARGRPTLRRIIDVARLSLGLLAVGCAGPSVGDSEGGASDDASSPSASLPDGTQESAVDAARSEPELDDASVSDVGRAALDGSNGTADARSRDAGKDSGTADAVADAAGTSRTDGGAPNESAVIINDRFWKDTSGTPIYSQGGGVLQVGGTFYWYGVKYNGAVTYAANPAGKSGDTSFAGVTTYSSKNLVDWKLESTSRFDNAGSWFGRLGVVYHAGTKKYVLVAQGAGGVFFATSDTPNGSFRFDNVQTSPPGIANNATGDQTLFQDDDGKAYVISSSAEGRAHRYVSPLRAADFLRMETAIDVYSGGGREGNCMFKYDGYYYFCSSDLHGWNASQSYCVMAPNIAGPYSAEFVMGGTERDFSHVTQTGFFISVKGSERHTIIFAGDRWSDFAGNGVGYNQWMPLSFSGRMPRMESLTHWSVDPGSGNWSVDARNNYLLNPSFEADRVTISAPAGWTASNGTNTESEHTGRWAWQLNGDAHLAQRATGLPGGTYKLSLWVKTDATDAQIRVSGFGGAERILTIPRATGWTQVSIDGISVASGQCDVAVATHGSSLFVDDFNLSQR